MVKRVQTPKMRSAISFPRVFLLIAVLKVSHCGARAETKGPESACDHVFNTFEELNSPLRVENEQGLLERIHDFDNLLQLKGVNDCWFTYKIRTNFGRALQLYGDQKRANEQYRLAVEGSLREQPSDVLIPAFNLATNLQTWSSGNPAMMAEADEQWQLLHRLTHDRSIKIRSATHTPFSLPTKESLQFTLSRLKSKLGEIMQDQSLNCENYQKCSEFDSPQNFSEWYPTYPLHYHMMDAADTMRISAAISRLYWRAAKGISWSDPKQLLLRQAQRSKLRSSPHTRIRVGFVSRYLLYSHSLGQHIRGIMANLDRTRFRVVAIHIDDDSVVLDDDRILIADENVFVPAQITALPEIRAQLAAFHLDVLVFPEVGMEAISYFLAFARIAPVQIATWCFPASIGVPSIDYFLSADGLEPDDTHSSHYWEQVVQFRGGAAPWFFLKEDVLLMSDVDNKTHATDFTLYYENNLDTPWNFHILNSTGHASDTHYYLVPQNPIKLHSAMDPLFRSILESDHLGIIVVLCDLNFVEILRARFRHSMGSYNNRVLFVNRTEDRYDFLELLGLVDVILDTYPWGGWTTTLQALAAGTPVVTLPGKDARSRFTLNAYKSLGFMQLVASNASEYVRIAVEIASSSEGEKMRLRHSLQQSKDVLLEIPGSVTRWHRFLTRAVRLADMHFSASKA